MHTRPQLNPSNPQNGFTLIEILVTMVVAGILSVSVFYFLSSQNKFGVKSNDVIKSTSLGKFKMDSLKVTAYDELTAGSDTVAEKFIRSWHITPLHDPNTGLLNGRKQLDLAVLWPLTAEHSMTFVSLKCDDKYKEKIP